MGRRCLAIQPPSALRFNSVPPGEIKAGRFDETPSLKE